MRKRSIAAAVATLSVALATAAPGVAKPPPPKPPPDPHMPNPVTGFCPWGRALVGLIIYCNGMPYDDGTFWQYNTLTTIYDRQGMDPNVRAMYGLHCVTDSEIVPASFAPEGGCAGGA